MKKPYEHVTIHVHYKDPRVARPTLTHIYLDEWMYRANFNKHVKDGFLPIPNMNWKLERFLTYMDWGMFDDVTHR